MALAERSIIVPRMVCTWLGKSSLSPGSVLTRFVQPLPVPIRARQDSRILATAKALSMWRAPVRREPIAAEGGTRA